MKNRESSLMYAMAAYCTFRGLEVRRRNVAGRRPFVGRNGKTYWVQLGRKGESDLTGTLPRTSPHPGRRFELEVKLPGEMPTREQYDFLRDAERAGAIAIWCDSLDTLARFLDLILAGYESRIARDGFVDFTWRNETHE